MGGRRVSLREGGWVLVLGVEVWEEDDTQNFRRGILTYFVLYIINI